MLPGFARIEVASSIPASASAYEAELLLECAALRAFAFAKKTTVAPVSARIVRTETARTSVTPSSRPSRSRFRPKVFSSAPGP